MSIWLLSFFVHSTFWFGLAWLSVRLAPRMQPQTRETIWYTAIAASLITPSFSVLTAGSLLSLWQLTLPGILSPSLETGLLGGEHGVLSPGDGLAVSWELALVGAWLTTAVVLLARYLIRVLVFRGRLARQHVAAESREWTALRDLSRRAGLRRTPHLTESESLSSPIAFGFGYFAEICVPTRALHELDRDEFTAMLGHEVAHHQRYDPARLGLMNILRSVFFFQPLFGVAGRDVHWAAEEQCDAMAANHVQDRMAVARCLTEVAGWVLPGERPMPVVGMAGGQSHLVRRVDRLIDENGETEVRGRSWQRFWAISVLAVAPWVAPGLAPAAELPHQDLRGGERELSGYVSEHSDVAGEAGEEHGAPIGEASRNPEAEHSPESRTEASEGHDGQGSEHGGREHGEV